MFESFHIFDEEEEEDNERPDIHTGTIVSVGGLMSGLQVVTFTDHLPVHVENYGHRRLIDAAEHLGLKTPVGMRIEFNMDALGLIMNSFQILGGEDKVACYNCQTIMEIYRVADEEEHIDNKFYSMCQECGHIYCPDCEDEPCKYCEFMKEYPPKPQ